MGRLVTLENKEKGSSTQSKASQQQGAEVAFAGSPASPAAVVGFCSYLDCALRPKNRTPDPDGGFASLFELAASFRPLSPIFTHFHYFHPFSLIFTHFHYFYYF